MDSDSEYPPAQHSYSFTRRTKKIKHPEELVNDPTKRHKDFNLNKYVNTILRQIGSDDRVTGLDIDFFHGQIDD